MTNISFLDSNYIEMGSSSERNLSEDKSMKIGSSGLKIMCGLA